MPLRFDALPNSFAQGDILNEQGIFAHHFQITAGQRRLDVGDEVTKEGHRAYQLPQHVQFGRRQGR